MSTDSPSEKTPETPAAEASETSAVPPWVRRGVAVSAMLAGWLFIAWQNRFYLTASVIILAIGWAAVVATIYLLWRLGSAGAEKDDHAELWWLDSTPRDDLEREKRTLLRTIRDVEFDQLTGKLSERDAEDLSRPVRARAIEVMKALDASDASTGDARAEIERELRARLEIEGARKAGRKASKAKASAKNAKGAKVAKPADGPSAAPRTETVAGAPAAAAADEPSPLPAEDAVANGGVASGAAEAAKASDVSGISDASGISGISDISNASDIRDASAAAVAAVGVAAAAAAAADEPAAKDAAREGSV